MPGAPHALAPLRHAGVAPTRCSGQDVRNVTTAEVENLEAEGALAVCRTFQSFSYAARLFFHRANLVFYVTLHHDGALWRVLKISELDSAEVAFGHFTQQATQLSEEEMRRTLLEAKNDELVRRIEQAQEQVERLRTDLDSHAAQAQLVSQREQRTRQEIGQLETQRIAAQTHLNRLRRQIQHLDLVGHERFPRRLTRQIRTAASSD
ncbi:DUF2968 domain-containing protein [Paraburkholderia dilworthii]|uniref:DUF2968 domain-containing protein n=1 Tax=Paraburkholderia dilworthii TaxID=948106 RepID=UPI0038BAF857